MPNAAGPGVDAQGRAVHDPTQNVLDLVRAESRRQDDLREAAEKLADSERRHAAELRLAESRRVDALRAGDQAAIATLAANVAATAEAMRDSQAATAEAFTKALSEVQRWQYGQQGGTAQVQESRADQRSNVGMVVGILGAALGVVSLLITVATIIIASR